MKAVVWFGNHLPPVEFQTASSRAAVLIAGIKAIWRLGVTSVAIHDNTCSVTIEADAATIERIRKELGPLGVEVSVVEEKPAFKGAEK